jgi:hypothetical protein
MGSLLLLLLLLLLFLLLDLLLLLLLHFWALLLLLRLLAWLQLQQLWRLPHPGAAPPLEQQPQLLLTWVPIRQRQHLLQLPED